MILGLAPTRDHIRLLALVLERSEAAIRVVYKLAFEHGPFGRTAGIQEEKILAAKAQVGIEIGRRRPRR